jgi:hypothetical protein
VAFVIRQFTFDVCKLSATHLFMSLCPFPVAQANFSSDRLFSRAAHRRSGEEEKSYPAGGVGHASLCPSSRVRTYLAFFGEKDFCKTMGPFRGE